MGETSEVVTQSESHVPWWPCPAQPQIPVRLQPLDSPLCRQTAGSTFHLVRFMEKLFYMVRADCPVLAKKQHICAIVQARTHKDMCLNANTQIEVQVTDSQSVFKSCYLPNYTLQHLMVKGKRRENKSVCGIKQTVHSCGCAFENP